MDKIFWKRFGPTHVFMLAYLCSYSQAHGLASFSSRYWTHIGLIKIGDQCTLSGRPQSTILYSLYNLYQVDVGKQDWVQCYIGAEVLWQISKLTHNILTCCTHLVAECAFDCIFDVLSGVSWAGSWHIGGAIEIWLMVKFWQCYDRSVLHA
jgi:hypothetical protein